MEINQLLEWISDYGHAAMFFSLWLGIIGVPIPGEVIVMTGGMATSFGGLQVVSMFLSTYLGVVSGLSIGYVIGYKFSTPVLERLSKKKKMKLYIEKSNYMIEKYGSYALVISYFLPIVRHVMPYLVGVNRMNFFKYASIAYTTGFFWTLLYFTVGYYFGEHTREIGAVIYEYALYVIVGMGSIIICTKFFRSKPIKQYATSK
ncbi:alkaline phosphatase [Bacillus manliponensis]|uniref:Alkaline phosphatase n=1 Tax=Bacillus manliponensis TaxID=574376 RepID=A0A073JUL9_9BACI|nr:DedA family protein [Bacillus manliponensis]KEK18754.1 alkaline phosphatase [Bacillus manliponensis]